MPMQRPVPKGYNQSADANFGPTIPTYARLFDFTLLFEQSILALPVNSLFIFAAVWRIWRLSREIDFISHGRQLSTKLAISTCLVVTLCANLVLSAAQFRLTSASIPAATVAFVASLTIPLLSYLEHRRSIRPSDLLSTYLLLSSLLDVPQARTLFLIANTHVAAGVWTASIGLKLLLLGLEVGEKKRHLPYQYDKIAAETKSGIFNRSLFLWLNRLFWLGFRRPVAAVDLDNIDPHLHSSILHTSFQIAWGHQRLDGDTALTRALWRSLRGFFLAPVPARICYGALTFAQPFLIHRIVHYLQEPASDVDDSIGYGLIGATALTYIGIAVANMWYKHSLYRSIVAIRGALVSYIYTESLSNENDLGDPQAAVTLMSTDVDRICQSLIDIHETWSRPLELCVGVTLLAVRIGWVCVMPLAVVLASVALDVPLTRTIGNRARTWTAAVQQRISLTAQVLSSIKNVKISGVECPTGHMLQGTRINELNFQTKFRWSTVWLNTIGNIPMALAAPVTFITYAIRSIVQGSHSFDTSLVFTSLALVSLVTIPASELLTAVPATISSLGSLQRIQEYLFRQSSSASRRSTTDENEDRQTSKCPPDLKCVDGIVASLRNVQFSTPDRSTVSMEALNLDLFEGSLTVLTGPNGCGKSTLLRAMLGSHPNVLGTVNIATSRVSYCPELPWLIDATVCKNICGLCDHAIDYPWYQEVVRALLLDHDFSALPNNDLTVISGQNANLNKGQRHRIALARALYYRPKLLLLDDAFSHLDSDIEAHLMQSLFSANGLVQKLKVAVVLATHSTKYSAFAENIIRIDEARKMTIESSSGVGLLPLPLINQDHVTIMNNDKTDSQHITLLPAEDPNSIETLGQEHETRTTTAAAQLDGDLADYVYYFKAARPRWFVLFIMFSACNTICYYMSQEILRWWTSDGGFHASQWMPLYACLALGNVLFFGCSCSSVFLRIVPETALSLHQILLDSIFGAPYSHLARTEIGVLINRFSQDMTVIDSQLSTGLFCTTIYLFWTLGSLILICTGSSIMAAVIPVVILVLYFLQMVYLRTSRQLRILDLETRSPLYAHFLETLAGVPSIKCYRWEESFIAAMMSKLDASQKPYYLLFCAQRWLNLVLDLIVAGLAIVVVVIAVKLRGSTNPASLGLALNNILTFNDTLSRLMQFWTQLEVSLGAVRRTKEFAEQTSVRSSRLMAPGEDRPKPHQHGVVLELCDLTSGFDTDNAILHGISMSIAHGEKIGICGRAGSGKTSLLLAVLGLLESSPLSISIAGVYLDVMPTEAIRDRITAVPQDPYLFDRSVRANLDLNSQFTNEQLIAVLERVRLWPLLKSRGGLDQPLEPERLSQGHKQLLSIARAMLTATLPARPSSSAAASSRIILVDDVMAGVDVETEILIQHILQEEFSEFAVLIVTRKLDVLLQCQRVAVLDKGRLVEFDNPRSLLAAELTFATLYSVSEGGAQRNSTESSNESIGSGG